MPPARPEESSTQPDETSKENSSTTVTSPNASPTIEELLARLERRDVHDMNAAPVRGAVSDYGQIHAIDLPRDWIESEEKYISGVGTRSFRMFHPPAVPDVMLCFYYRGLRICAADGAVFRALLDRPAHGLTEPEMASIASVLREKGDGKKFEVQNARTEEINKKRVLIVEGRYLQSGEKAINLFLDTDGTGTAVQEVYFVAPSSQYSAYFSIARDALYSIKWK